MNPFEELPQDMTNELIERCKKLEIDEVYTDMRCPYRYKWVEVDGVRSMVQHDDNDVIPHIYIKVRSNPFLDEDGDYDENQFFEYMEIVMDGSVYWTPWCQNWYLTN